MTAPTEPQNATVSAGPGAYHRLVPVGTIAFLTALYAALYLVWEQSHWGSPAVRDLVGNVAFMPFNLAVLTLFALASRQRGPGSRRAPGAPAAGARRR